MIERTGKGAEAAPAGVHIGVANEHEHEHALEEGTLDYGRHILQETCESMQESKWRGERELS